jgi:hypothetical protein
MTYSFSSHMQDASSKVAFMLKNLAPVLETALRHALDYLNHVDEKTRWPHDISRRASRACNWSPCGVGSSSPCKKKIAPDGAVNASPDFIKKLSITLITFLAMMMEHEHRLYYRRL